MAKKRLRSSKIQTKSKQVLFLSPVAYPEAINKYKSLEGTPCPRTSRQVSLPYLLVETPLDIYCDITEDCGSGENKEWEIHLMSPRIL